MKNKYSLTIGWLYPDLMSTYGDRGNIFVLQKRSEWRGINLEVVPITIETSIKELDNLDIIFGGGAQDREQEIVMRDLHEQKGKIIKKLIEQNKPALFVCGSPQLMGNYYEPAVGTRIEGLGIFDMISVHPGPDVPRCIGNIVAEVEWENLYSSNDGEKFSLRSNDNIIVGFENHGGRTYLGNNVKPFAKVIKGYGNNGDDKTEGCIYKNAIGCYFHGPLLPKNPIIADWILERALEVKYGEKIEINPLDDTLEHKAQKTIMERLGVNN